MEQFPSLERRALPPVKREKIQLYCIAVKCQKVKETWHFALSDENGTTRNANKYQN